MKKVLIRLFYAGFCSAFLGSCLMTDVRKKSEGCGGGEAFDSSTRGCVGARVAVGPPTPTLSSLSLSEDSGRNTIILPYIDFEKDVAHSCRVTSVSAGFVRERVIDGIKFKTKNTDPFGHNISVAYVDNGSGATSASADDSGSQRLITIRYRSSPMADKRDVLNALRANYKTNEWVVVSLSEGNGAVNGPVSRTSFNELTCSCDGGVCRASLEVADNWQGAMTFTYSLADRDGYSEEREVVVRVSPVNDPPTATNGSFSMNEDGLYRGSIATIAEVYDAAGLETLAGQLAFFSKSVAPLYVEMVGGSALNVTETGGVITIEIVPAVTTTDQVVAAIRASSVVNSLVRVVNRIPGALLQEHPKTLLRPFESAFSGDTDPTGQTLGFELVSPPRHGELLEIRGERLSHDGNFTYRPSSNYNSSLPGVGMDSFSYRVRDTQGSVSPVRQVRITVIAQDDAPVATTSRLTSPVLYEDSLGVELNTLGWMHPDADTGDDVETCAISDSNGVLYPVNTCSATVAGPSAGTVSIRVNMEPNISGERTFTYYVTDADDPANSTLKTVSVNILEVDDRPYGAYTQNQTAVGMLESPTSSLQTPLDFTLDEQTHPDTGVTQSYSLVTPPQRGTLEGCLGLSGSSDKDVSCRYTPFDGNISGMGTRAMAVVDANMSFQARAAGVFGNNIEVQLMAVARFSRPVTEPPALAYVEYDSGSGHPIVRIVFNPATTTYQDIRTAVENSAHFADHMIVVAGTLGSGVYGGASASYTLAGGVDPADKFTYRVSEDNDDGDVTLVEVPIQITPVNDAPVLCEYTPFGPGNTICGPPGCIGDDEPAGRIPAPPDGLHYYNKTSGTCWTSRSGSWILTESHIANKVLHELYPIFIDTLRVNEGGGATESSQTLRLTSLASSNTTLLPSGNIQVLYDGNDDGDFDDSGESIAVGGTLPDGGGNAGQRNLYLQITPVTGQVGTSTVSIGLADSEGGNRSVSFDISIEPKSARHGGWEGIWALGPKINKLNQNREDIQYVCPYSRFLCRAGSRDYVECKGMASPVRNANATPLSTDAIYYNTEDNTCYRLARTEIGNLQFIAKRAAAVAIELTSGGTFNSETVSVAGGNIVVAIDDGVSTTNSIKTAIEGHSDANSLVKVENRVPLSAQSTAGRTPIVALSANSWVPFQSHCNITHSGHDRGCFEAGLGSLCVGFGNPNNVAGGFGVTPKKRNTAYYDMANDICYRSVETDGATNDEDNDGDPLDWSVYSATASVRLIWNNFRSWGVHSISGYNVYRRIASERFDYDDPINRTPVPVASRVSYVDNAINSTSAPIPGTVYYYEVWPIINNIPTNTNEVFKTVRVLVPPPNMAFVHRWMVNQSICRLMHSESIDPYNQYRCEYEGPGDSGFAAGENYYDFGQDLIVQRFEAGCPYTADCDTSDGQCIGNDNPDGTIVADPNSIYYSRSSGRCFVNTTTPPGSGSDWVSLNARCDFHPNACGGNACIGNAAPGSLVAAAGVKYLDQVAGQCHFSEGGGSWVRYSCQFDRGICDAAAETGVDCYHDGGSGPGLSASFTDPNGTVTSNHGALLFVPSTGRCWQNVDDGVDDPHPNHYRGTRWVDVTNSLALPYTNISRLLGRMSRAELPPLTFVDQEDAASVCSREEFTGRDVLGLSVSGLYGRLPSRKEQIAYGQWDAGELSPSVIVGREGGTSLDASSKCNTLSASGLESSYSDVNSPDSNNLISLPGSETSGIRSVMTGSGRTGLCVSRYGIQDHIGNVAEWALDRILCSPAGTPSNPIHQCDGVISSGTASLSYGTDDFVPGVGTDSWERWRLDGIRGPCVETGGACNTFFAPWTLENERFSASRFSLPLGLPIDSDSTNSRATFNSSVVTPYFLEIAPTSGITAADLHNDTVDIQNRLIEAEASNCGGILSGGHYTSGDDAGVWHLSIAPCTNRGDQDNRAEVENHNIGFRCVYPVSSTDYEE